MEEILQYLNNYFYRFYEKGTYAITNNSIPVRGTYLKGQYIRIEGSVMNDGVYKINSVANNVITVPGLFDEQFTGCISGLAVPQRLTDLEVKIQEYKTNNKPGVMQSESFGNYSYTRATNKSGEIATWKDAFALDLRQFRCQTDNPRKIGVTQIP